jgi:thermitase
VGKRPLVIASVLFLVLFIGRSYSFAQATPTPTGSPPAASSNHEVVVVFKDKPVTKTLISFLSQNDNLMPSGSLSGTNAMVFSLPQGSIADTIASLKNDPDVETVFPNNPLYLISIPNDPEIVATPIPGKPRMQWNLFNTGFAGEGKSAWDITTGSPNTVVAVLDSTVDSSQSDLSGKFSSLVDCSGSYCFEVPSLSVPVGPDSKYYLDLAHGTHVAGLVGAATANQLGIASTGYNTKMMMIKLTDEEAGFGISNGINAIRYAADHGAKVITMSWGKAAENFDSAELEQLNNALSYAWDKGVVLVAAAGNCGEGTPHTGRDGNPDACDQVNNFDELKIVKHLVNPKYYPAASPNVISVAASTFDDKLASYSDHGDWVSVTAPGGSGDCFAPVESDRYTCILSTWPSSNLFFLSGTSMAAPQVAGLAALLFAEKSGITNAQVKDIIGKTAHKASSYGSAFGLVDALAAVSFVSNEPTPTNGPTVTPGGPTPTKGPTPTVGPTETPAPTAIPTLTPTPTITPYPTTGPARLPKIPPDPYPPGPYCIAPDLIAINGICPLKSAGDANCDPPPGKVDELDYKIWLPQYDIMPIPALYPPNQDANFSCTEGNSTTYFVDMVDYEIWRRHTISGLITPVPTGPVTPSQATLFLEPSQASFAINGAKIFDLKANFANGSSAQKLDYFKTEISFSKDFLQIPAEHYIDTSMSGFKKIFRVDGPTAANDSGKIIIELGADVPGGGPVTSNIVTIGKITFAGRAQTTSSQNITIGTTQIVDNRSQALSVATQGVAYSVGSTGQ